MTKTLIGVFLSSSSKLLNVYLLKQSAIIRLLRNFIAWFMVAPNRVYMSEQAAAALPAERERSFSVLKRATVCLHSIMTQA